MPHNYAEGACGSGAGRGAPSVAGGFVKPFAKALAYGLQALDSSWNTETQSRCDYSKCFLVNTGAMRKSAIQCSFLGIRNGKSEERDSEAIRSCRRFGTNGEVYLINNDAIALGSFLWSSTIFSGLWSAARACNGTRSVRQDTPTPNPIRFCSAQTFFANTKVWPRDWHPRRPDSMVSRAHE